MIPIDRWRRVEELFERALKYPSAERAALIAREAIDDPELESEVRALLNHADPTGLDTDTFQQMVGDAVIDFSVDTAERHIGSRVDRYHLTGMIGQGGMGIVYMAERNDGEYKRQVAVKLLRPGIATPALVARLRDERQVLATFNHPGIVKLLDGGTTSDGLPYLVMEYVEGIPLSGYSKLLPISARVQLVAQVADTLQYAHQKLVIHRDVKPSNILVDTTGVPKLLDFGIAKLLDGHGTGREASTRTGVVMFTPEYASPEQVRGESVTVASDVYALGAVLYELLTGQPPQRAGKTLAETIANICTISPLRPSLVAPSSSRHELVGDLDSVTLRALQKEPHERYQSAAQFADDIRRYLDGMPVTAHEATRRYRARKFLSRHRGRLALAVAVAGALTTATVVSLVQARRADQEAQQAIRDKRALLRERGLQELASGRANRALPYLVEAMREGDESTALRLLLDEAMRPYSRELVSIPITEGAVGFAFAPDESLFAISTMAGSLMLFGAEGDLRARIETSMPTRNPVFRTELSMILFSQDGKRIAARNTNGTVHIWNATYTPPRQEFVTDRIARDSDRLIAFSTDGSILVAAGAAGGITLVDIATGEVESLIQPAKNGSVISATSTADGHHVALGMSDGTIRLWHGGSDILQLDAHSAAITALAFTKDGDRLVSGYDDGTVRIWDTTNRHVIRVLAQHQQAITAMELTHDDIRIATAATDGSVVIWDFQTGQVKATLAAHPRSRVRSLHFSRRDDYLVTTGEDATFRVWDAKTAEPILLVEANSGAGTAGFSPPGARDARIFAGGSRLMSLEARYAKISKVDRAPLLFDLVVGFPAAAVTYSPNEEEIAVVGASQLAFWNIAARTERLRINIPNADLVDARWSPRGDTIVVVGSGGLARIYDIQGRLVRTLQGHDPRKTVHRGSWSPDGRSILTASQDGTARIWDVTTDRSTIILRHPLLVSAAAWHHSGTKVATSCRDGNLRLWNADLGTLESTIDGRGMNFLDVTFSPDGSMLAATGRDGDAGIWDVSTGERVMPLEGHNDVVITAVWSPKGDLLATTADDGVVAIWDPTSGAMLTRRSRPGEPLGLTWNRHGTNVLVASNDGHVRAWEVLPVRDSIEAITDFLVQRVPYRLVGTRIERAVAR